MYMVAREMDIIICRKLVCGLVEKDVEFQFSEKRRRLGEPKHKHKLTFLITEILVITSFLAKKYKIVSVHCTRRTFSDTNIVLQSC